MPFGLLDRCEMGSRKFVCGCGDLKCKTKIVVSNDPISGPLIWIAIDRAGILLTPDNCRRLANTLLAYANELEVQEFIVIEKVEDVQTV